ncbi:diacylglycerol kinase [Algoriphagus hitonicola]|uniref:Diacylglycerol kinase (ATP) n=1 Tax=Algoriphagus hitonicola TaxID=435880 RepID=A0A1I2WN29_9BACT|nr:diacylglycerol kinase family protein [Algoriphagus hitonicola]SFH02109.1 diacylglycerol kinase (ATP) [Algoriphagus hitonicola]
MSNFILGRIKSIYFALKGFFWLIRNENSIITQSIFALGFTILGFYLEINRMEWALQILAIGFVLAIESLNTAVEKVCDFIHPDYNGKIGLIKDISSGAVAFAVFTAILIACLIYIPYLL